MCDVLQLSESLLLKLPLNGSFLLRKSEKEPNTNVLSLVLDGKVYHNKVCQPTCAGQC